MPTGIGQMRVFAHAVATSQQKRKVNAFLSRMQSTPTYGRSNLGTLAPVTDEVTVGVERIGSSHSTRSVRGSSHE